MAANSCCVRSMSTNPASAEQPSDPGSIDPKWAAEEQHWVPLFNTIPEVPTLVSSHVSRNSCARLCQRLCQLSPESCWDLIRCADPMRMAIWQTSPLSSSCLGCPRLCDVVLESLRNFLEKIQSMSKSKVEIENMQPPPAAYGHPVLKRNRAKRMKLFTRLLEIDLLRPSPKGT